MEILTRLKKWFLRLKSQKPDGVNVSPDATGILIGRNDPCHCGSGQKYKKCCLKVDEKKADQDNLALKHARIQKEYAKRPPGGRNRIASRGLKEAPITFEQFKEIKKSKKDD